MLLRVLMGLVAVMFVTSAAQAADGAAIFKEQCAKCHGDTGQSDTTIGKAIKAANR